MKLRGFVDEGCRGASLWSGLLLGGMWLGSGGHSRISHRNSSGGSGLAWRGEEVMGTRRLALEQDKKQGLRAQAALFGCFAGSGVGNDEQKLGLLVLGRGCQRGQGAEASGQPQQMPRVAEARGRDPSSPSCVRLVPLSRRERLLLAGVAAVLPGQG